MAQILNLKDASAAWRKLIASLGPKDTECIVQDEQGQSVAVMLPMELYRLYQGRRERNFAVLERIAEKMQDYDQDVIESQIEKAVADVKAEVKAQSQAS